MGGDAHGSRSGDGCPMRVLTFTSLFPNKSQPLLGIFVFQRILHLSRRPGCEVQVIAPVPFFPRWLRWGKWQTAAQAPIEERSENLPIHHPRYPLLPKISMPLHGLLMFLGSQQRARSLQRKTPFDCIDAHFIYPDGTAAVLLGKVLGVPVVVSARGTDINLFPTFRLIRPIIRWTLRNAAGVIAVSASLKQVMLEMGLPQDRIRVIGNGIDPERFNPVDPLEARKHLNMPETGPVIVSVGSLIPRKGFQHLIAAFAEIAPRFLGARLYIVGEGSYRSELEALAERCNIQDRVALVGDKPNEELRFWFSAANVSCLVSSREGWPNVLQESLACGTPVVATRLWGAPEVVTSAELGLLVDQNTQAIASGLDAALGKRWDREAIARHAQERTWEVVAAEVEDYLTLVASDRIPHQRI
jgi:teichuronic acid biosynthesis glycosyltransferase TuaC